MVIEREAAGGLQTTRWKAMAERVGKWGDY
jgi:hypothetical protein